MAFRRARWFALAIISAATVAHAQDAAKPPTALTPFTATYSVEWRGMTAGVMTMRMTESSPNYFSYESTTLARGLARLLVSDAVKQASSFRVEGGTVVPVSFRGVDEKERATQIEFDWTGKRLTGVSRGSTIDVPLDAAAHDPLTLQVATQRELAAGALTGRVWMFDGDRLKEFEQRREKATRLKTALGEVDTVSVTTQRVGSNRLTRTWYAPTLGYLPVQAQRVRDGKPEVTIRIRTLKR
jgi:hypothetical protein